MTCERCGFPKEKHCRVAVGKEWSAAGMGFINVYQYICPTAVFQERVNNQQEK